MEFEFGPDRPDAVVDRLDHCGVALHVPSKDRALVGAQLVPRLDLLAAFGIARWEFGSLRDDAEFDLSCEASFTQHVPANVVPAAEQLDVLLLRVERSMDGTVGVVQEDRFVGVGGLDLADHPHGAFGEIVGEVVVVGVLVGVDHRVALVHPVRMVEVGERFEEAVVLLETALHRPRVLVAGLGEVGVLAQMPLAHSEGGIPAVAEHLGDGRLVLGSSPV